MASSIKYLWKCENCEMEVSKHIQPHEWWKDDWENRGCPYYDYTRGHVWRNLGPDR